MIQAPVRYYRRIRGRQALAEAEALLRSGDAARAVEGFDLAAGLAGADGPLRRRALAAAADLYGQLGRPDLAVERSEQLAHLTPDDPETIRRLAEAREAAGRRKDAADAWLRRVELAPEDEAARARLAGLIEGPAAIPHLRWALERSPDDMSAWRRLAAALEAQGDEAGAADAWLRALTLAPADPVARDGLLALLASFAPADAAPRLEAAAAITPRSSTIWKTLARTRRALHDIPGQLAAWRGAAAAKPGEAAFLVEIVRLLTALGDTPGAARVRVEIAEALATDVDAWRVAGRALAADAGDPDAAIAAWTRLLALAPDDFEAHAALGLHHRAANRPAEAVPHLRVVAAVSGQLKDWRRLAVAEDQIGDAEGAARSWAAVLERDPEEGDALRRLSALRLAAGDQAGAIPLLRRALDQTPGEAALWRVLAGALIAQGDKVAAAEALKAAHKAAPRDAGVLRDLVKQLQELGDREALLTYLRIAAQVDSQRIDIPRALARLLIDKGEEARAAEAFERVLELDPNDLEANRYVGMRLYDLGQRAQAEKRLAVIAERSPTDIKLWRRLAWARRDAGDLDQEIATLEHLLTLTPDDEEILVHLVESLFAAKRRAEAEPMLLRLAALRPDEVRARLWLARARSEGGDMEGAMAAWREALALNPAEPDANAALGEALLKAGDVAGAADCFAAAAAGAPKPASAWSRVANLRRQAKDRAGEIFALQQVVAVAAIINMDAHKRLVSLLDAEKRLGEATESLALLIDAAPDDLVALRRLAQAHHANGDAAAEIEAWGAVVALQPADVEARRRLARLTLDAGAPAEAAAHLAAVPAEAAPVALWKKIAAGLQAADDADGELAAWRRVEAADPSSVAAHARLADLLLQRAEGAAAEPHLAALIAARPDDHNSRERLALILSGLGRKAEAAEHFAVVARQRPSSPKPWKRWARLLAETGDLEGATGAWRQVLALGADDQEARENLARLLQRQGRHDEAATYLRGLTGAAADNLTRSERRVAWLGRLNAVFARADLKILDVGARGGPLSWMAALAPFADYFACEPESGEADRLTQALLTGEPWRGVTLVREGLGKTAGDITLHLTEHPGFASTYPPNPEMAARYGLADEMRKVGETTIPVITLAEAASRYGFEDLGLLKIDVQGGELDVIEGGEAIIEESVQAIFLEAEFREFYKGQPLFADIERRLRGLGFELVRMEPVSRRRVVEAAPGYSRHELLWAHALFVKRTPDAGKLPTDVFLKRGLQQVLIALAYEQFDLAADLAFSAPLQAALAEAGLAFERADFDAYIAQAMSAVLLREFEAKWPTQVKSIPHAYT